MLSTTVKTTRDLMSIALQAEREAIRRYSELAEKMRLAKNESAAALFLRMVNEEQEHENLLLQWMEQEGIKENLHIEAISWRDPQVSTTYNDEAHDPYQSSPYRALAFAVHNEELAFRFYTHVAAESDNEMVRKYAEILAREELGHAALLRAERRRAYHNERDNNKIEPILDPRIIHNETDLLTAAIHIDNYLLTSMNSLAKTTAQVKSLISETQQQVSCNQKSLETKPAVSKDTVDMLEQLKSYNAYLDNNVQDSDLKRLWACCDRSFAFYDSIVETSSDETTMLAAQKLSATALDRIGALKQAFEDSSSTKSNVA